MQKNILYIIIIGTLFIASCRSDQNRHTPPVVRFESIRVLDNLATPMDTTYRDIVSVTVHSGARLEISCQTEADGKYGQMDLIVYGMAKDSNNILLDTAYVLNSAGQRTYLTGNSTLDWPNTSFRTGFKTETRDSLTIVLPRITDKTSLVILISDRYGLNTGKNFIINKQ